MRGPGVALVLLVSMLPIPSSGNPWPDTLMTRPPEIHTWYDSIGPDYSFTFFNVPYNGNPASVFAYYSTPAHFVGKLPAIVLVHGGASYAMQDWAQAWAGRGYAAISMDLNGFGPDRKLLPDGRPWDSDDFSTASDTLNCWYYSAVAAVLRSTAWVAARPEVDRTRIGIMGISWGGWNVCNAAGTSNLYKAACAVFGCGAIYQNSAWSPVTDSSYINVFDPKNYLSNVTVPFLFYTGNVDPYFSLFDTRASSRLVGKYAKLCIVDNLCHSIDIGDEPQEITGHFADCLSPTGTPDSNVLPGGSFGWGNSQAWMSVDSGLQITRAELVYTTKTNPWDDYNTNETGYGVPCYTSQPFTIPWQEADAGLSPDSRRAEASILPGTTVYYLNLFTGDGRQMSSPIIDATLDQATGSVTLAHSSGRRPANRVNLKISSSAFPSHNLAIEFVLPGPDQVAVRIYNLSGREITSIVNEYLDGGSHRFLWATRGIATGCYVVRMQAGSNTFVKSVAVCR